MKRAVDYKEQNWNIGSNYREYECSHLILYLQVVLKMEYLPQVWQYLTRGYHLVDYCGVSEQGSIATV